MLTILLISIFVSSTDCFSAVANNGGVSNFADSLLQNDTQLLSLQKTNRNECLIDLNKLGKLPGQRNYIVGNANDQIPIAELKNVLVIPLDKIKLRTFLKNDTLILLPHSAALHQYLLECGKLRKSGFKHVFVLKDGMLAIESLNKANTSFRQDRLVGAKSFFLERNERHWIVVCNKHARLTVLRKYLAKDTKFIDAKQLHSILAKYNVDDLPIGIIVVDVVGDRQDEFEKIAAESKRSDIFYLKNGINGFERFVQQQRLITSKRVFVLQKPKSCGQ